MFKTYGSGSVGLKVLDYQQSVEMLIGVGFGCIGGHILLSDLFFIFAKGVLSEASCDDFLEVSCPEEIARINDLILAELKSGCPYAVRSSALSERGGTGIYRTDFILITGDIEFDRRNLWQKELAVYASEFSSSAKAWRKKTDGAMGLAIWITEVLGTAFDGYFLPPLSGTAHTSYQGLPTVRVVAGLGTKAVAGKGLLYNAPPSDEFSFSRAMWNQEDADAINLQSGKVETISHNQMNFPRLSSSCLVFLFDKLVLLKEKGDFSLEWVALEDGSISIVQCAPYEDKNPGEINVDVNDFFFFTQSRDVFNSGLADCRGVVFVPEWSLEVAHVLENLNSKMSKYLLIVTQDAFSDATRISYDIRGEEYIGFGFEHFSNAAALLERKISIPHERRVELIRRGVAAVDHTRYEGQGASHFQQLCSRADILFVGAEIDIVKFLNIPGAMRCNGDILIYDMKAKVFVDATKKIGQVFLGKQVRVVPYFFDEVTEFAMEIRKMANELCDVDLKKAEKFYNVSYAIGVHKESPFDFDPFFLEQETLKERGLDVLKENIQAVICEAKINQQEDVVEFLKELLEKLNT
jgi:hypothetical protein